MNGLTSEEVNERIKQGLINDADVKTSRSYTDIFVKNAFSPFNIVLFVLGIALLILHSYVSAISATGIIIINIIISTIQEMRAKRRLDQISLLTRPKVTVIRDGEEKQVDQGEVVKDDLIVIRAGEQAVVDGTLNSCKSLEMDESLLTGESTTVRKNTGDFIYSGSVCVTGEGYFTVTAFGDDSYASQMLSSAKKFTAKKTPLQMETQTITTILITIAFIMLFIALIREIITGTDFFNEDELAATIEVFVICIDVVPIGLFLLITLTYMIAAIRMANTGVLLQSFNSVESISHVDTVCMDKTGTITTNNLVFESAEYMMPQDEAELCIRLFASNTGSKNKTMTALTSKFGDLQAELVEEIQFSSARKYSAVKVRYEGKVYTLYSGAWNVLKVHLSETDQIDSIISRESSKGLRTLVLCASEDLPLIKGEEYMIHDLTPVAVVSIRDEVRSDCRSTIQVFLDNGMDLKVISGDDPVTVEALFKIADIPGERRIISGPELDQVPDSELDEVILNTNIFGRMKPENKETVIEVLKRNRRYVAMIGDGVNDVKPIKSAHVGVALESGSGAARGVADMILIDDNFSALPKALVEGRRTVSGIRDILKIYLSRNLAMAMMFIPIFLFLGYLPMLPVQNSFYAFTSVTIIAFFMTVFAKPDENDELILPSVLRFAIPSAIVIGLGGVIVYLLSWYFADQGMFELDLSYLAGLTDLFNLDVPGIIDKYLVWQSGSYSPADADSEIIARNCLVLYATLTGAIQLLIVCPRFKFLSTDGNINKRLLPIILVVVIILFIIALYAFLPQALTVMALVRLPDGAILFIIMMVIIAFFLILFIVKMDVTHYLVNKFEKWYLKKLDKEYVKGDVVNIDGTKFLKIPEIKIKK